MLSSLATLCRKICERYSILSPLLKSCRLCREAFADATEERANRVRSTSLSDCQCEKYSSSRGSIGRVADHEKLVLVLSDPNSLLPTGLIHPGAVNQAFVSGLSTLRDGAADDEFELTIHELKESSRLKGRERYFHGVKHFAADAVRFGAENSRFMCVYDTPLPGKPHHVDIMAPSLELSNKEIERRKKELITRMGSLTMVCREFRDGRFTHLGRPA